VGAAAAKPRKLSHKEQRELDALPAAIERLEAEQATLHTALSDPALFQESPNEARDIAERSRRIAHELETAYARWELLDSGTVNAGIAPGP
jgi:ATP-binding cassette subfamily F protein uup